MHRFDVHYYIGICIFKVDDVSCDNASKSMRVEGIFIDESINKAFSSVSIFEDKPKFQ